jgi:NAD(P)-dependent dehydrogenase (short-subunit alcohol dehydrogenase family)
MSDPTYDFEGQVALVTGASSGMGLATARAFARARASVVLADIDEDALHSATEPVLRRATDGAFMEPSGRNWRQRWQLARPEKRLK